MSFLWHYSAVTIDKHWSAVTIGNHWSDVTIDGESASKARWLRGGWARIGRGGMGRCAEDEEEGQQHQKRQLLKERTERVRRGDALLLVVVRQHTAVYSDGCVVIHC